MHRFATKGLGAALVLSMAITCAANAAAPGVAAPARPGPERLTGAQVEALFTPASSPATRAAAIAAAVAAAQRGDGHAAFYLGVLHRHGKVHPAGVDDRNADTARHWLQRCVEAPQCPRTALDSLSELELVEGNHKAAMQWAQASATLGRELARLQGKPDHDIGGYTGYLLKRNYESLPRSGRDALVEGWFGEFLAARGKQLDRMLAYARDSGSDDSAIADEHQAAQLNRVPRKPALGLYLLRMSPSGGQPESVLLVEALPTPSAVLGLEGVARRFEGHAYAPRAANQRNHVTVPIVFRARY